MNVTYTERHTDPNPAEIQKLQTELDKVAKILDSPKGQSSAHVRFYQERYLHHVEITIGYHGHELVVEGSGADFLAAIHAAVNKMEKQAIRLKDKWRDSKREPHRPDRTMPDNNTGPDGVTDLGEIKKTAS